MNRSLAVGLAALSVFSPLACRAQPTPAPSPSPPANLPQAPASAPVWHNPTNSPYSIFDPCAGPREIFNKLNPSPCVLVLGQAEVGFGYANINTHGSVSVVGPLGQGASLPISGNANAYPMLTMTAGVSSRSQLQISAPSYVALSAQRLGSTNVATDLGFNYKQLLYFSPTKFTLAGIGLGYTPPTNGISTGPSYTIQPQLAQPFNADLSAGAFWTFKNAPVNTFDSTGRGWSDPIGLYLSWTPTNANFAFLPLVTHQFSPNRTTVILDGAYMFSRYTLLNVIYGGLNASSSTTLPFAPNFTFATNLTPRIFAATFYVLIGGESNLPPMPPPSAPAPAPTPSATEGDQHGS
jgi:hypothetical protein